VFIVVVVVVYCIIDSVHKLLDTPSYTIIYVCSLCFFPLGLTFQMVFRDVRTILLGKIGK
jgi:hypothetical protein